MNREDIIRMVREVADKDKVDPYLNEFVVLTPEELERFAALIAAHEREKSLRLWMLLDDVDTADDIAKGDDALYRSICQKYQKRRWEILSEQEVDDAIRARGEG